MKNYLNKSLVFLILMGFPTLIFAEGLVPCDGLNCDFEALMELVQNVLKYIVEITVPLSAIMFAYAGFLYMTSQGSLDKRKKANQIFTNVGIGLFFVLAAWLIVKAILVGLKSDTSFLNF